MRAAARGSGRRRPLAGVDGPPALVAHPASTPLAAGLGRALHGGAPTAWREVPGRGPAEPGWSRRGRDRGARLLRRGGGRLLRGRPILLAAGGGPEPTADLAARRVLGARRGRLAGARRRGPRRG